MDLTLQRFGAPAREMVGLLQHAPSAAPRARWLLCRPMGQEATRTSAMFRALSERLAREGCEVLRFDWHGTGDSPGEEAAQSIAAWVEDALAAHERLAGGDTPVCWFGMGLGANIALRAAARARAAPAHLVLWEPVLDGAQYLRALMQAHKDELQREMGHRWSALVAQGKAEEPAVPGHLLGFEIGARLADELQQLRGLPIAPALRRGIAVTCAVQPAQRAQIAEPAAEAALRVLAVEDRIDWMSSQAMGSALVPQDVMRTLLALLP